MVLSGIQSYKEKYLLITRKKNKTKNTKDRKDKNYWERRLSQYRGTPPIVKKMPPPYLTSQYF